MNLFKDSVWETEKIGQLVSRVGKSVSVEPDQEYREIGIRSHGKGIFHKKKVFGSDLGNKRVFWIEPDCFVVNIVFAWEQAIAKTTGNEDGFIASHRFPMYKPILGKMNLEYLLYFFKTKRGKYLLELASPGGAGRNKTLGQQAFLDLSIPVPSLPEQEKIAEILGTWDEAIGLEERLIAALQTRKKGLMQRLLTGKVRFPGFDDEWEIHKLGDVAKMESGGTPSTQIDEYWEGDIPWISGADFDKENDSIARVRRYITQKAVENSSTKIIPSGNLVLVSRTGVGKIAITPFDLAISQDITGLKLDESILDIKFARFLLSWTIPKLARFNQGTSINGVTRKDLKKHSIIIPSIWEQKRIVEALSNSELEIELHKQKLAALQTQKKGLMQRLLTGQVRVSV